MWFEHFAICLYERLLCWFISRILLNNIRFYESVIIPEFCCFRQSSPGRSYFRKILDTLYFSLTATTPSPLKRSFEAQSQIMCSFIWNGGAGAGCEKTTVLATCKKLCTVLIFYTLWSSLTEIMWCLDHRCEVVRNLFIWICKTKWLPTLYKNF